MKNYCSPTVLRSCLLSLALGFSAAAQAACPTASTRFQAYQADINGDGVVDTLFVPVPTVIVLPLGDDDDLIPLVVDPGLPAFNYLSSSAPATVSGVPANAVPVSYTSTLVAGDPGTCGVLVLRGQGAGLATLVVSFSSVPGTPPTLVQTLSAAAAASSKISYGYDPRNRLLSTSFGDGSPGIGRSYTPDGLPATVSAGGSNGSTWTYLYNNRRLLTQETLTLGSSNSPFLRGYDANGHLTQLSYPDGSAVSYAPDALGEPTQVSGYASAVAWAPNGSLAGFTYANGIVHSVSQNLRGLPQQATDSGGVVQDSYSYDEEANLVALSDGLPGAVASRAMAYDGLDRLTTANSPGVWGSASYGYDPLDNLRTSSVGARSTSHNYDGANRLAQLVSNGVATAYGYDAQGNVTAKGSRGFLFDIGNRLIASGSASYAYDGLGRRTVQNGTDGRQRVQMYSADGQLLYGVYKPAGGVASSIRYIYLGGKVIAEADPTATGGVRFLHTDGLGSPVARTDATGALIDRTRYEPYGATAAGTNPGASADNIGFTGHANDPETGLVYMQQRYYDPIAGRFLSTDPVATDGKTGSAFSRYMYANNNPYRFTDPDGRDAEQQIHDSEGWQTVYQAGGESSGDASLQTRSAPMEIEEGGGKPGSAEAIGARGMDGGPLRPSIAETQQTLSAMRVELAAKGVDGLADLARFRADLGLKAGEGTLSRLDVNGQSFYGINAHGQAITMEVNAISRTHAEADAFQQALNAGARGGNATLYVDRSLCAACGQNGGVRSMARQLGINQVTVITPQGSQIISP